MKMLVFTRQPPFLASALEVVVDGLFALAEHPAEDLDFGEEHDALLALVLARTHELLVLGDALDIAGVDLGGAPEFFLDCALMQDNVLLFLPQKIHAFASLLFKPELADHLMHLGGKFRQRTARRRLADVLGGLHREHAKAREKQEQDAKGGGHLLGD